MLADKKFKFYSDPGHAWVAVKRADLDEMGLLPEISNYSYQKGKTVYLEEDSDAVKFVGQFFKMFGKRPNLVDGSHTNNRSPIRNYNRFIMTYDEHVLALMTAAVESKMMEN